MGTSDSAGSERLTGSLVPWTSVWGSEVEAETKWQTRWFRVVNVLGEVNRGCSPPRRLVGEEDPPGRSISVQSWVMGDAPGLEVGPDLPCAKKREECAAGTKRGVLDTPRTCLRSRGPRGFSFLFPTWGSLGLEWGNF